MPLDEDEVLRTLFREDLDDVVEVLLRSFLDDKDALLDEMTRLIRKNHIEKFQYMLRFSDIWSREDLSILFLAAIKENRIEAVLFLYPHVRQPTLERGFEEALQRQYREMVQWLLPDVAPIRSNDRVEELLDVFLLEDIVPYLEITNDIMIRILETQTSIAPLFQYHGIPQQGAWIFWMDVQQLRDYLQYGGNPNAFDPENGISLLHNEASASPFSAEEAERMKLLLDAGANPNMQDEDGNTALHYAYTWHATKMLLMAGADPTIRNKRGVRGWTFEN